MTNRIGRMRMIISVQMFNVLRIVMTAFRLMHVASVIVRSQMALTGRHPMIKVKMLHKEYETTTKIRMKTVILNFLSGDSRR